MNIMQMHKLTKQDLINYVITKELELVEREKKIINILNSLECLEKRILDTLMIRLHKYQEDMNERKTMDYEIFKLRIQGIPFANISKEFNLSNNEARRAYNRYKSKI